MGCILELDRLVKGHIFDRTLLASEMVSRAKTFVATLASRDERLPTARYYLRVMERIQEIGVGYVFASSNYFIRYIRA